jgi:peptidylprolyl isomerase
MVFQLGDEDILEGFQARLVGMCRGERRSFTVPSREAYGDVHPALIKEIPKKEIPIEDLKDGEFLNFRLPDGDSFTARVVEARQNAILCDFNHVLAGKDLFFDVEILDIRKEI